MKDENRLMTPIRKESVVQQVINKITDAIISGELRPRDKLPTEMEMVAAFHVGRNTVREAVRTLEAYGVVEIRRPEGTFICSGFSERMINPLLYSIILEKEDSYKDLIGLRYMIETGVMKVVREQGLSDEENRELDKRYAELVDTINAEPYSVSDVAEADMRLHEAFARATHNQLIMMIHSVVAELTRESRYRTIQMAYDNNDKEQLIRTHKEQIDALRGVGDISMDEAIENSYIYWKNSIK